MFIIYFYATFDSVYKKVPLDRNVKPTDRQKFQAAVTLSYIKKKLH